MNLNGMFGKLAPGMCRLSMNGDIAVKTDNGYKTYNIKTGRLTNCDNFVFDIGEDFFFLIPTNNIAVGDIILVANKPRCVTNVEKNQLTVINYESGTVETILPERHVFMGNNYMYGKIMSVFGNVKGKKKGMNDIMKYMMLSEMAKGNNNSSSFGSNMLPFMMMGSGGFDNMFGDLFDFNNDDEEDAESEEE